MPSEHAAAIEAAKTKGKLIGQEKKHGTRRTAKRKGKTAKNKADDDDPAVAPAVYTIPTFCRAHDLSEAFYFKLKKQRLGPREMKVGGRVLISYEAAADWRRAREQAEA
jgi:hypothetical protein